MGFSCARFFATSWTVPRDPLSLYVSLSMTILGIPGDAVVKNPPANVGDARDAGSIPGWGRSSGAGNGKPLQYSCLENPMDRGAWQVTLHGVAKSQDTTELAPNSTRPCISLILFRNSSLQPTSLEDPSQPQRINLITFFATHPSLLYTHPFTFYILDFPLLWISLFPHVLCFPNSFFGNKVCICPSSSSLWSLIFRKPWP